MAPRTIWAPFRLKFSAIACTTANGKSDVLHLPAEAQIILIGRLDESDIPNRMVEIEWNGQRFKMFAVDILDRGEPV
jgi:hypothetical protein